MIRPNNPAIDVEDLRRKVSLISEKLRSNRALDRRFSRDGVTARRADLRGYYRAANGYLDRAEDFAYPQSRLPHRLAMLERVSPKAALLVLRAYNFALRPVREASVAQTRAIRELTFAGIASMELLLQLEKKISELQEALENRNRTHS